MTETDPIRTSPTIRRFARLLSSVTACNLHARDQRVDDGIEHDLPVGASERRFARPLGVRHQADDVAPRLQMPAMSSGSDPFGLASFVTSPVGET